MIDFKKHGIKAVILDMDGVLWKDSEPIGDLPTIFQRFSDENISVVLATNNATRTVSQYLQKIKHMGVVLSEDQIVTSGQAVIYYLRKTYPSGSMVYVVGSDGLKSIVTEAGFSLDENNAAAVVVGVDRDISYNKIRIASKLIREGAEFIGTNPDKTFPTPRGLEPGAGSIIASVAAAAEKEPVYVGKPGKIMMDLSLSRLQGITKEQVLQVGDRLDTDIAAGQNYGCLTAVVLSGVTSLVMAQQWRPEPDFIYNDLAEIVGA
jgi:4-nitrophenyl phosphatase